MQSLFTRPAFTVMSLALVSAATSQFANAATPKIGSDYTTLNYKKCKTVETSNPESPYVRQVCPSLGGYRVEPEIIDMRSNMTLKYGKKKVEYGTDAFSRTGDTAEWRYRQSGSNKTYHAFIYRLYEEKINPKTGEFYPASQDKQTLIIIRLNKEKSCVLGVIPASTTMNEQARKLADNPKAMCKY